MKNILLISLVFLAIALFIISAQVAVGIGAMAFLGFIIISGLDALNWISLGNISQNRLMIYSVLLGCIIYGIFYLLYLKNI